MDHKSEIANKKYENWVRGGLAYKYLKQGLEGFADDVVKEEHKRILRNVIHASSNNCSNCNFKDLRPLHTCKRDHTGKKTCPYGQRNCNCLQGNKKQPCPSNICGVLMDEILNSHGTSPPQPYWKNTDIQKWCTEPWEVAKCFINAPGYSDKTKAAEIDAAGLLHVFINNTSIHTHLACPMSGSNIFIKVREGRNKLFHSANMEMEDTEVTKYIDDIVEILEDPKELNGRSDAQLALSKLKQLKQSDFEITTNNETAVCREALAFVKLESEDLKQTIQAEKKNFQKATYESTQEAKHVIDQATDTAKESIKKCQQEAVEEFYSETLYDRVGKLETDADSMEKRVTLLESNFSDLESVIQVYKGRLNYVESKQELQDKLVEYYQKVFVKTSLCPLKQQQDNINIKDIYVPPKIEVIEEEIDVDCSGKNSKQDVAVEEHFLRLYERKDEVGGNHSLVRNKYRETKIPSVVMDNRRAENQERKCVRGYHEIFHTKERHNKKIYVLGDVGTGKSTFCKMMIENWCYAVTGLAKGSSLDENVTDRTIPSDIDKANKYNDDVSQLRQYEFLFFIPLQFMSAFKSDVTVDMIKELTREFSSDTELIDKIFQEDSRRCLIIADSLDEWRPPKEVVQKPHVSYGIPNGDRAKDATVIILSRPSSRGILNLKNSEIDLKLQLLGITNESMKSFIERYISKSTVRKKSRIDFLSFCRSKGIEHVEKTPLLLQQHLWLYCNDKELGNSVSETYCHIFNTMYGWLDQKTKGRENDASQTLEDNKKVDLPAMLKKFPRLKKKSHVLFRLGKIAYETLTSDIQATCGISCLIQKDLLDGDVNELKRFGILNESNCYDPTLEDTQLSFIHISYLEFFAALYVTTSYTIDSITQNDSVLDELFGTCKSASDVLQLSNVIKMICGLSPAHISYLSKRISCIVNEDEQILNQRKNGIFRRNDKVVLIQRLIVTCLKECVSDNKSLITLSDLYIDDSEHFPPLQIIISEGVISMTIKDDRTASYLPSLTSVLQEAHLRHLTLAHLECYHSAGHDIDLSRHNHLQTLTLVNCPDVVITGLNTEQLEKEFIDNDNALHYFINTLNFNLISQANKLNELHLQYLSGNIASLVFLIQHVTLKELTLIGISYGQCNVGGHMRGMSYDQSDGEGHVKGVSNNQSDIEDDIKGVSDDQSDVEGHIKGVSDEQPEVEGHTRGVSDGQPEVECHRRGVSNEQPEVEGHIKCVSDEQPGVERHTRGESDEQPEVEGHIKGVSDDQSGVEGHTRGVSDGQPEVEGHIKYVSDEQPGVESHIKGVIYGHSDVEGHMKGLFNNQPDAEAHMHALDLSKQNKLQKLQLYDCKNMTISNLNTEQLEYLHISDGVLDFDLLKNANRLIGLYLHGKFSYQQDYQFKYSEQINDVVHTLHQLRILRLEIVDIYSNSLTVTPEMKCLKAIELYQVNMKFDTWCIFVDSLLTLQQCVEVLAAPTDKKKYVRNNSNFKVINKVKRRIHFKSRI